MLLPIDVSKLSIILIGDPIPQYVYGTKELKKNSKGEVISKLPVLISGTSERQDPTTTVTVSGTLPNIPKGSRVQFNGLVITNWSLKGNDGVTRNGVSLRAESVIVFTPKA